MAHKKFIDETGEDFTKILDVNPIRASIIIKINPDFSQLSQLKKLAAEIEGLSGIFEVDLNDKKESEVESIHRNIENISIFLGIFALISILTIIILINNTIKLALFSQRFLIRSMQLVGATSSFIQMPFLQRSSLHGFLGGVLSAGIIYGLLQLAYNNFQDFQSIYTDSFSNILILLGALPIFGVLIGLLSSYWAMNKYLKMSLDDLY
jgi:cell division transport system permease protein